MLLETGVSFYFAPCVMFNMRKNFCGMVERLLIIRCVIDAGN